MVKSDRAPGEEPKCYSKIQMNEFPVQSRGGKRYLCDVLKATTWAQIIQVSLPYSPLLLSRYPCPIFKPHNNYGRVWQTGRKMQDGLSEKTLAQQRSNSVTKQSHTPPPPVKEHALVSQHPDATHAIPGHGMHYRTHTWSELEGSKNGNCRREWRIRNDLIAFPSSATCSASPWVSRNLHQKLGHPSKRKFPSSTYSWRKKNTEMKRVWNLFHGRKLLNILG